MSLQANNVTKIYGKQKALNNVSFEIKTGEVVGFLGPNGAGKSTMMKIMTGYIKQNSGEVTINRLNTNNNNNLKEIKNQIGYLPEHNPLYHDMYVIEYLNFIAKIYQINKKSLKKKVDEIIEITGLNIEQNKKIGALSKGYKQRTGLAAALIHDPEVLILDEPTTGLDPNQIIEIRKLITEVGKEKTVMLSTHIMQEVEAICNRVIIINKGEIAADAPVSSIRKFLSEKDQSLILEFDKKININVLNTISGINKVGNIENNIYVVEYDNKKDVRPDIFHFAVENNLIILSMHKKEKSMEDVFRSLTKEL